MALKEALVLMGLDHENIIKIFTWEKSSESGNLILVLEYCANGDMEDLISSRKKSKLSFTGTQIQ